MRPKLLLLDEPCEKAREIFKQEFELITPYQDYTDAVGVYVGLTPIIPSMMPNNTKFIACPCTGIDHLRIVDSNVVDIIYLDDDWKCNEGRQVTSTAEHTWSLILQMAKKKRMQLSGKTIGIIGLGRIGSQVCKYAEAFSMNVMHMDTCGVEYDDYKEMKIILSYCDIITLHVPLNESTKYMIGRKEFQQMKAEAILVNTSRADIVDYDALMGYENKVYYADDFADKHILNRRKTIQTNHIGGNCIEAREMTDIYIANKTIEWWRSKNP